MTTVVKSPTKPQLKSGSKRFHTIHLFKHIFTIQKNGTSVLSFRNKSDAVHFGKILESHYDLTNEWPVVSFEDTILYNGSQKRMKYLNTKQWYEDDIRDFCIENCFGMLDIVAFENDYRLIGNAIQWDVPMNFYIEGLNKRLEE
jgi:hypothetical protein